MVNIFIFIIGAVIGSFLNVCIHRLPKKQSIVRPPSHCPKCGAFIKWHDNIPIISYAFLGGRCRHCHSTISFRYLLIEVVTAVLAVALYISFGLTAKFFSYFILTSGLTVATFVDFDIQEIPDEISIPGIVLGITIAAIFPAVFSEISRIHSFMNSFMGAAIGGVSIYAMGFLGEKIFKREAMGGGDVKLLAMIGAFLGWKLVIFTFFVAPIFGSIVGVILKIKDGREIIPYGPYLSLAAIMAIFFGEKILGLFLYNMY